MIAAVYARKSMIPTPPTLFVLLMLLIGCAPTLAEIRAWPPQHAGTFASDYRTMARCTADALDARTHWQYFGGPPARNQLIERADHVEVIGSVPSTGVPIYEVRLAPAAPGQTTVELRYGRHGVANDAIWPTVEKCGGKR